MAKKVNGVDVDQLVQTVEHIKEKPELAKFTFRAKNKWIEGGHSRTTIGEFYGAGKENMSRAKSFVLEGDEPEVLLGGNAAPNAVEAVLHALASCIAVGFVYNAAAQGIKVENLETSLEGDLDLQGFLGLDENVRPGYNKINIKYKVEADASDEELTELCKYVQDTSPVLDIVRNPVEVSVSTV